jgi:peptide/nickel transport system ATP-binding protein
MTALPLLRATGLRKTYRRGGQLVAAVDGLDIEIEAGETLALAGPSGCGKSTLARLLLRLVEPDAGSIAFNDGDWLGLHGPALRHARRDMQIVFQDPLAAFNPRATVGKVIEDPLRVHGIGDGAQRRARMAELLDRVGLSLDLAARHPHELSGGQRQRVAIARAIATRPKLVVLDEALSALDVLVRADIMKLLRDLQAADGMSYLHIGHDLSVVAALAQRLAIMERGTIVETGPTGAVLGAPSSAVGKALVAAQPRLAATWER